MLNLNRMAVFAAVAERGSFTAAAEAVGLTKSMVSQHVSALEDELGVRLMQRTTRSLRLTEAGEVFYEGCRKVTGEAADLTQRLQALKDEPVGKLRIATLVEYATGPFAAKLAAFLQLYPRVEAEVVIGEGVVDLVKERIDVAFRLGWLRDSSLAASRVGEFEQVLVAAPGKVPGLKTPADLAKVEHIALTLLRTPRRLAFKGFGTVTTQGRCAANSPSTVRALCLAGAGFAALGHFMVARDLEEGRLVRLLPGYALPRGGIFAVLPTRRAAPPKVRALLELMKRP